jgi:hypothetical protein
VRWDFSLTEEESVAFLLDVGAKIRANHGARAILLTQKDWLAIFVERNSKILQEQFLFPQPVRPGHPKPVEQVADAFTRGSARDSNGGHRVSRFTQ